MQTLLKACSNGGFLGLEEVTKLCGETFRTRQGTSNRGRFQEPQRGGGHQEPQRRGGGGEYFLHLLSIIPTVLHWTVGLPNPAQLL